MTRRRHVPGSRGGGRSTAGCVSRSSAAGGGHGAGQEAVKVASTLAAAAATSAAGTSWGGSWGGPARRGNAKPGEEGLGVALRADIFGDGR
ncbi:hypothetical protein NQ176_g11018 [Zarea fungicola]|uniref:Uncharacterized protein n=1 Tax=Zarea fungicola TaxID=93591 RepID=A0ACC1MDG2_9HYPO|nr:hypothetical protein NQ176_g11018 [Lecanicillium fungicola]